MASCPPVTASAWLTHRSKQKLNLVSYKLLFKRRGRAAGEMTQLLFPRTRANSQHSHGSSDLQ